MTEQIIPHLRTQFERGNVVLFTGAGFSMNSRNPDGEGLPAGPALAEKIWQICFPSDPFDTATSLQDVYEAALLKNPKGLAALLTRCLSIDPKSIEDWLANYFSLPWYRIYSLNIDDLMTAVARHYQLPRRLVEISATNPSSPKQASDSPYASLETIYLNGCLADLPRHVTFSASQYAHRLAFSDDLYQRLVADVVSRPVVFVGTRLDEPSLWQHIEIRRSKGPRGVREMRPRSYLVTPTLDRAREARLSEFNIAWVPMRADEFAKEVLARLGEAASLGLESLRLSKPGLIRADRLPEVGDLAVNPHHQTDFLLGQEPIWADLQSGRAVERVCDQDFWASLPTILVAKGLKGIIVVTGTAGSGKSTCLMRLALTCSAASYRVAWIDRHNELLVREIVAAMESSSAPGIIAIDDADLFGWSLSTMLRDIVMLPTSPLAIVAIRSGSVDRVINTTVLRDIPIVEVPVPHLADVDIDSLIDVLSRENRLGALQGKSRDQQRSIFRVYSGRQLLVAMYSATSGKDLQEKAPNELFGLPDECQRQAYALVALATTFRYNLTRQEMLIALNNNTNETLNAIELLLRRHIIVESPAGSGRIQARHRLIAEFVRDELQLRGQLNDAISGLAFMAATYSNPGAWRRGPAFRLLRSVISHEFLYRSLGLSASQAVYQQLESLLASEAHYWLQRGSLEVEFGDIRIAENFLGQARGLSPNDLFIENEWAYLLFRKALDAPGSSGAPELVREATEILEGITQDRHVHPHAFHVLGSQGLAWSRKGLSSRDARARYLRELVSRVEVGVDRYPKNQDLIQLRDDLKREYLMLAVD